MRSIALSWVIGLWIFLTFLFIYISIFSYKVNLFIQVNKPKKIENKNPTYIYKVYLEFDPNYVFFCDNVKEFCENFPIFIPTNFNNIPYGTFNDTIGEYFEIKNFKGLFFLVNLSNKIPKSDYMIVKVCNNENADLYNVQIRIPVYYLKYQGITQLEVKNLNNSKDLYFCYEYENLECLPDANSNIGGYTWDYHIWVKLNLSKNSCVYLNISKGNNAYATDGSEIFDYYFTKFVIKFSTSSWVWIVWDNTKKYNIMNVTLFASTTQGKEILEINGNVFFNSSLFSNKISDFYMIAYGYFYVNDSFYFPASSNYSWYKFYDLRNWSGFHTIFYIDTNIDTIRIRKKANVTVEIVYPKIRVNYTLILGEKPKYNMYFKVNPACYIDNGKITVGRWSLSWWGYKFVANTSVWLWYLDSINPSLLNFNRTSTFAYANYSNIFIILPPNSYFTIIYNKTMQFNIGNWTREEYDFYPLYNLYIWERSNGLVKGVGYDGYSKILLWYPLDINRTFFYIFYGEDFDRFTIERMIDFFKFPEIKIKYVAGP